MPTRPKTHRDLMLAAHPELRPRDDGRGNAAARGYDGRWRRARARFLRRNPLCLYCTRQQRVEPATLIDHNPPHLGDKQKFWNVSTWVPACAGCHNYITPTFDGGSGQAVRPREGVYVAPRVGEVVGGIAG